MSRLSSLSVMLLVLSVGVVAGQTDDVKINSISYADLGKLVRSHKGKVVVVYLWHES